MEKSLSLLDESFLLSGSEESLTSLASEDLPPEIWDQIREQALRALASTDPLAYGEYAFRHVPAPHHAEMVEFIRERLRKGENGVILEPRGHAKTTWGNTIFLSWLIANNLNIRVALISKTEKQANSFSRAIRFNFEANEYHREIFGDLVGPHKWTDDEWIQRDSALSRTNNVTMYSRGALSAIVSKRFDIILCDDIVDNENSSTPEQREKMDEWFWKTLKPCLAPGGSIIILGTRWFDGDLYQKLIEEKRWPSLVRGAITYEPDDVDKKFPTALWPQVWNMDLLLREKEDMGSAMFACAYLNDISGLMEGNVFRKDWFKRFDPEVVLRKQLRWKMGVDLASSEKQRADYTARVVIAEDNDRNTYVFSVVRDKIETGHRGFVIDGFNAYPKIDKIIVENNQFQSSLVAELLNSTDLPVVGKRSDVDKVTRARAVAARYESGKVFHHPSLEGSDFEIELLQFPRGHDDMIDALGNAMETGSGGFIFGGAKRR